MLMLLSAAQCTLQLDQLNPHVHQYIQTESYKRGSKTEWTFRKCTQQQFGMLHDL